MSKTTHGKGGVVKCPSPRKSQESSQNRQSRQKRSHVYTFFTAYFVCKLCQTPIKSNGSTSNLWKHLRLKHPTETNMLNSTTVILPELHHRQKNIQGSVKSKQSNTLVSPICTFGLIISGVLGLIYIVAQLDRLL